MGAEAEMSLLTSLREGSPPFGRGSFLAALAIGLLTLVLLVVGLTALPRQQREAYGWVAHTLEVLGATSRLDADLEATAGDGRAYMLLKDAASGQRFEDDAAEIETDLASLQRLTADNAAQQSTIKLLQPVIARWLASSREIMRKFDAGDDLGAMETARAQHGRALMDQAVATITKMADVERGLLEQRGRAADRATRLSFIGLLACCGGLAASVTFTLGLLATRRRERKHIHEMQQLNAELAESEAQFRATFEQSAVSIAHISLDGRWLRVNGRLCATLGYTEAELLERTFRDVTHPDDLETDLVHVRQLLAGEVASYSLEKRYLCKHGATLWSSLTVSLARDLAGAPQYFIAVAQSITDRKQAEAALYRSEARLQLIVESATDYAIITTGIEGTITGWNSGAEQILGWSKVEALGRSVELFFTPEDRADGVAAEEMQTALERGRAADERWHLRHDGKRFWANGTIMPMRAPGGEVVGYLKILRDQTRQHEAGQALRRSEAALAASEAQLRGIVESSADSIKLLDLEGTVLSVNGPGLSAMEIDDIGVLHGQHWTKLWPELAHPKMTRALAEAREGGMGRFTAFRPTAHGTPKWWDVVVSPVLDSDGVPVRLVAISRDVTAARRAETALRESEAQLRQAQKLEAIGRLAAGVAHDFNNILQGVTGGLELALDEVEAGTPAHEFAEIALSSARRGSDLTSHLLSYARKQMLQPRQLDVASFLAEMQKLLRRTLGPHICVEVLVDQATPPVQVDPGQLETALLNLAINAAHAMPRGGTLSLDARSDSEAEQRRVIIAVTDTGMGMDEATLAQACEPFFTTKGVDGTGLGLSMVQGFAEQSGGEFHIASTPGAGTTVQLWLPAAIASAGNDPESQAPSVKLRGSGRILLVDDVSDVLVTASAFLERAGFQVSRAESGKQALALLIAGERFDAVVSDYAMPGLNGLDLIEQARAVQPSLPALLITGFAEVGGADAPPEAVAILRKPFQRSELVAAVLQAVGQNTTQAVTDHECRHGAR